MTTLLATFIFAFLLSLTLTPVAKLIGLKFGAIDTPGKRKVHSKPVPRTGGLSIFLSVCFTLFLSHLLNTKVSNLLTINSKIAFLFSGSLVCFGIGLFDDFKRLGPKVKIIFQIIAGTLAFLGGIHIGDFKIFSLSIEFGYFSYFLTIIWFLFFINAVNLVDGLDGLAGGIVVFASVIMVILSILRADFLTALFFTALSGGVLGFLRYNYNPATIFLGDGGSYFLGYAIAGLSILSSSKSQVGAAILIPVLALGVPLFDTIISPLRRFLRGRKIFYPDNEHVHHRLLYLGFSTKKAVWLLYLITASLCSLSLVLVNVRDEKAGLFIIVIGTVVVFSIRKLKYFNYFGFQRIHGWFKDVSDEAGLRRDRRCFLSFQIDINNSKNFEDIWTNTCKAFNWLEFDLARLKLENIRGIKHENIKKVFTWSRSGFEYNSFRLKDSILKIELPLVHKGKKSIGSLRLVKDAKFQTINAFTLRRVEHLRRTLIGALERLEKEERKLHEENNRIRKVA